MAQEENVSVLARIPLDPAMAEAMDKGEMENIEKNYLEPVADYVLEYEKNKKK